MRWETDCVLAATVARVFLAIALLLGTACSWKKSDPAEAAESFFALLSKGQTREAYDRATFAFQTQQSFANFEATVRDLELGGAVPPAWKWRVKKSDEASLDGEITTKGGKKISIAVTLIPESREWKIYALHTQGVGDATPTANRFTLMGKGAAFSAADTREPPPIGEITTLVRESLVKFDEALRRKDFGDFYKYVAATWQAQLSEVRLRRAFQPFLDGNIRLEGLEKTEPVFAAPPAIDLEGLLVVRGYFPLKPYRAVFSLKYVYELPRWKLFGIDVDLVK